MVYKIAGVSLAALLLATAFTLLTKPLNFYAPSGVEHLSGYETNIIIDHYTATDHNGHRVKFKELSDQPIYLYLGFTSCTYSCPLTMQFYKKLAQEMPSDTRFALLTTDPEKDSTEILKQYLQSFDEKFIGLRIEDQRLLKDMKNTLAQPRTAFDEGTHHDNTIYLKHPRSAGLIAYKHRQSQLMQNDLAMLNRR